MLGFEEMMGMKEGTDCGLYMLRRGLARDPCVCSLAGTAWPEADQHGLLCFRFPLPPAKTGIMSLGEAVADRALARSSWCVSLCHRSETASAPTAYCSTIIDGSLLTHQERERWLFTKF